MKKQRKAASSSWASGVRWEEGESCQWGQGVSGSARGELAVRPHKQSGPCARSRAGACGVGRRSGFGGCPFEETGRAGPRFGSRGGRPGRLAASGRAGQKQAGLGWVVRLGGLGPARVRGLLVFVFYLNGPFK